MRTANHLDIEDIVDLGEVFWHLSSYGEMGLTFSREKCYRLAQFCIDHGVSIVQYEEGELIGALIMSITENPFSADLMACDIYFFVRQDKRKTGLGRKLLQKGMDIAESKGVVIFNMMNLESVAPEASASLYESLGLRKVESTFTKAL